MQMKTTSVEAPSTSVDLYIHKRKSNILKCNTENTNPIALDGETLEDVKYFTYLESIIDKRGASDADVNVRINKENTTFLQLKNICKSKELSTNIKVRIFNKVLLYGAGTWRTTTIIIHTLTYITKITKLHHETSLNIEF
ncbi:unnamed protein product [Schistosoma margrebowiei]|uniref:Uncharacterized protein n=1 Tax=Schistosoma margrebowiei TaxID=48269 RepID=A0A183LUE7_9TREM|nr:unnamed protein product [Schistosoma margrebowiei]